ncbi:MAG: nucleotidyl transferase AbiEii/AbiGii toxin family protein [Candidatus Omnitrophica bacterium]|nr:nucleotidyl transferase AbiEii/AbiGii toxin family protein [Candidatus Omnitrophota bacterium]
MSARLLAGKLGLLMDGTRKEPRDLFDLWFLLNRLVRFEVDRKRVREFFRQKYGFYPSVGVLKPHLRNRIYKERWETRLKKQMAQLPEFDIVASGVESKLKQLF